MTDPYITLGIHENVSDEDVKAAYHAKLREFPPEDFPEEFSAISEAYDAIRSESARTHLLLFGPFPPPEQISRLALHEKSAPPEGSREMWTKEAVQNWFAGRLP